MPIRFSVQGLLLSAGLGLIAGDVSTSPFPPQVEAWRAPIAQTWHPDDDRFGATFDELRAACVPDTQNLARPLHNVVLGSVRRIGAEVHAEMVAAHAEDPSTMPDVSGVSSVTVTFGVPTQGARCP